MQDDKALDLIAELEAHCVKPEFSYRHRWRFGNLVMWDNAGAMHLAICECALPERRLMHHTTVIGTQPF
jgi:alpha-ketoglutarate-dependent taurine dioxygenase